MTNPTNTVTVWTLPACVQCVATKRALDKAGIPHTDRNLADDPDALAEFKAEGHAQAPIVVTPLGTWTGFRPDLIKTLKDRT